MTNNLQGFVRQLTAFNETIKKNFIAIHKRICFELYKRVLEKTPVDMGFLRGSWGLCIGHARSRGNQNPTGGKQTKRLSGEEQAYASQVLAQLSLLPAGQIVWLTNTMPYCEVVEFGLYPNPPKYGSRTRVGKTGRWRMKMRSANGFSKQAPAGMVQVSINELKTFIQDLVAKANAPKDTPDA